MTEHLSVGEQTPEDVAGVMKALADPNRLLILDLLMQNDSCNCELNGRLGLTPNLLSHHLRVLRQSGLVRCRRDVVDGRWIYYAVDKEAVARWRSWLSEFLDPERIRPRPRLCGPEGRLADGCPSQALVEEQEK